MNSKIKELSEKRDRAMNVAYKASFKNSADDYRKKLEIFNELDKQLKQALQEEAENDSRN